MSADDFSLRQFADKVQTQHKSHDLGRINNFLREKVMTQLNEINLGTLDFIENGVTFSMI
ncbi:MAG: hypothetical protein HKP09_02365, partial [Enterobacterales bacterium]|nr:hypothetical protein [Enterobacterales bacterium]